VQTCLSNLNNLPLHTRSLARYLFFFQHCLHSLPQKLEPAKIDVVFPSSEPLESALSKLETRYYAGKIRLSEVVDQTFAEHLIEAEK